MTIKISQLGNLTTVHGNVIVPVVGNISGTLTSLQSNVAQLQTYILGTVVTDLANLTVATTANAAIQHNEILTANVNLKGYIDAQDTAISDSVTGANAAIVTANVNMKGYVDGQITPLSNSIIGANAAIVTANVNLKGYVDAGNTIQSNQLTAISNSIIGANAAIVTANTAMKGYVDAQDTAISNSIIGANAAIVTANVNLKGYVDAQDTAISNSIIGANAAIVTANVNLKGYVDEQITTVSNSIIGANAAIVTANTAMKGYVDANAAIQSTSIDNIINGTTRFGNIIPTANLVYNLGDTDHQWNSINVNTISTTSIVFPYGGSIVSQSVGGLDVAWFAAGFGGAAAIVTASVGDIILNRIAIAPTYAEMVIHNANTSVTHTWNFSEDGDITLPANGTISYTPTTSGDWAGTAPTTIEEAIDRLATVIKALNSGTGA